MGESCTGTCIMEGRFQKIEDSISKQADQYLQDRVNSASEMTGMRKDIEKILEIQTGMNDKLTKVLEQRQQDEIKQAANENKVAATKWQSLSASAKAIIVTVIGATIMLGIGYLFNMAK